MDEIEEVTGLGRPTFRGLSAAGLLALLYPGSICAQVQDVPKDLGKVRESYYKGFTLLQTGRPRQEVIDAWQQCVRHDPEIGRNFAMGSLVPVVEITSKLRKMLKLESWLEHTRVPDPSRLPLAQRIGYHLSRFVDVRGSQDGTPVTYFTTRQGSGTRHPDAIIRIGRPAIPGLIKLLSDDRPTRSVWHLPNLAGVISVQDVAHTCLEEITGIRFAGSNRPSNLEPEKLMTLLEQVTTWWHRNRDKSRLQGLHDWLNLLIEQKSDVQSRVAVLLSIEKSDPGFTEGQRLIREWTEEFANSPSDVKWLEKAIKVREYNKGYHASTSDSARPPATIP